LSAWGSDTGGEFGVAHSFMVKTVRLPRVRREIWSGEGREGWPTGRAGEFATSVGSFGGQPQTANLLRHMTANFRTPAGTLKSGGW